MIFEFVLLDHLYFFVRSLTSLLFSGDFHIFLFFSKILKILTLLVRILSCYFFSNDFDHFDLFIKDLWPFPFFWYWLWLFSLLSKDFDYIDFFAKDFDHSSFFSKNFDHIGFFTTHFDHSPFFRKNFDHLIVLVTILTILIFCEDFLLFFRKGFWPFSFF